MLVGMQTMGLPSFGSSPATQLTRLPTTHKTVMQRSQLGVRPAPTRRGQQLAPLRQGAGHRPRLSKSSGGERGGSSDLGGDGRDGGGGAPGRSEPLRSQELSELLRAMGRVLVRRAIPGFTSPYYHTITTVDHLAEAVSTAAHPASLHALLAALLEGHRGYHALAQLVLRRAQVTFPEVAPLAAAVAAATSWEERARSWGRLLSALKGRRMDALKGRRRRGAWWAFQRVLKYYCWIAAASPAADCTTHLSAFLRRLRDSGQLALVMAVAVAAGELRQGVKLSGLAPLQLQSSPPCITLRLLEAPSERGIFRALPRLHRAAQVLVWALQVGNPGLAALGPVEVDGIVGVLGHIPRSRRWNWKKEAARITSVELPGLLPAVLRLQLAEV